MFNTKIKQKIYESFGNHHSLSSIDIATIILYEKIIQREEKSKYIQAGYYPPSKAAVLVQNQLIDYSIKVS